MVQYSVLNVLEIKNLTLKWVCKCTNKTNSWRSLTKEGLNLPSDIKVKRNVPKQSCERIYTRHGKRRFWKTETFGPQYALDGSSYKRTCIRFVYIIWHTPTICINLVKLNFSRNKLTFAADGLWILPINNSSITIQYLV